MINQFSLHRVPHVVHYRLEISMAPNNATVTPGKKKKLLTKRVEQKRTFKNVVIGSSALRICS